jgi:hypothetical protein
LPLGAPVNIGPREYPIFIDAPVMAELVRRGAGALPALLDHLPDARPTKIVFGMAPRAGAGRTVVSGDDYDCRYPSKDRQPAGVNTKERDSLGGDGTYCIKVGDLCYIAVGEIVDRKLYVVGWHGGGGAWPMGAGLGAKIVAIDSPVERPSLAAAARADWGGLTAKDHEQSLLDRIALSLNGVQVDLEAVDRLLLYYPTSGLRVVEDVLRRNGNAWAKDALVKELKPFQTPELNSMLYQAYKEAVAAQNADLRTQPAGTWDPGVASLGSMLPSDCARLLIHQGHDDEFRAFAQDRIARIKEADKHSPERPAQNQPAPGIDTLRIVHLYELGFYKDLLEQLDGASQPKTQASTVADEMPKATRGAHVTIESIEHGGGGYGPLVVHFGLSETAASRVRAARVVVTRARDDAGVILEQTAEPRFSYITVGRTSDDVMTALPPPSLSVSLTSPSRPAKNLAILEGWLEVVVPDLDRYAVATVEHVKAKVGKPVDSEAFLRLGMTIKVFDRGAGERYLKDEVGPGMPGLVITEQDLAVLIKDEKGRLVSTEFRSRDGSPLRYNHNGWAHYGSLPGTQLDIYRFEESLPVDAQMVCLLATPGALIVAPFKFTSLALP